MKLLLALAASAALLAACSPKTSAPAAPAQSSQGYQTTAGASTAGAKFDTTLSMAEVMGHVVNSAAFAFWKGSGTEVTAKGERDLSPTTAEGWEALENGAATLVEAGNTLQLPGRVREPVVDWNRYAQAMSASAVKAKAAAEKHDKAAAFQTGADLYQTCVNCHAQFVIAPEVAAHPPENVTLPSLDNVFSR